MFHRAVRQPNIWLASASLALAAQLFIPRTSIAQCNSWVKFDGSAPSPRYGSSAIYDPVRQRMLLFGGASRVGGYQRSFNDLWQFTTDGWAQVAASGTPPGPISGAGAVYDPVRDRMLLFRSPTSIWSLSLAPSPAWSILRASGTPPPSIAACVFDPARDRVMVLADSVLELTLSDTGATWGALGVPSPITSTGSVVLDLRRNRLVAMSGEVFWPATRTLLWELPLDGGTSWHSIEVGGPPLTRGAATSVYDMFADRMIIYGGYSDPYGHNYEEDDTWAIDLDDPVTSYPLQVGSPGARLGHVTVFDAAHRQVVTFGGVRNSSEHSSDTYRLPIGLTAVGNAEPSIGGSVMVDPPTGCLVQNSTATYTAVPATGWHFVGWTGDASGDANPIEVTVDQSKRVTANFEINTYTLAVTPADEVEIAPIQPLYPHGATVRLTAASTHGLEFVGWEGDASGRLNPLDVRMDADMTILATFGHPLRANVAGQGTIRRTPDQPNFVPGSTVELAAQPATYWHFVEWSGDASGSANPLRLLIDGAKHVTATFAINTYALAIAADENGNVAKSPDQASYEHGSRVRLTAVPNPGWHFVGWSGDAFGSTNPIDITLESEQSIRAHFGHHLDVTTFGDGQVVLPSYNGNFLPGVTVDLIAEPDVGWRFVQWGGDASGTSDHATVTMDHDKRVTAQFEIKRYHFSVDMVGEGRVAQSPDRPQHDHGTTVTLTATPAEGWQFIGWSGDFHNFANPLIVTANAEYRITAHFSKRAYTLQATAVKNGRVIKTPNLAAYEYGSKVVLTAVPDPGYRFAGWSGDVTGTANPETVVVLRPLQTVATFERIPPPKLALKGVSWDADGRSGLMSFTSSGEAPVLVEIFDLAGRRRASLRLEGLTAGAQETRVATDPPLGLGVFFARISQGSATARRSFPVKR